MVCGVGNAFQGCCKELQVVAYNMTVARLDCWSILLGSTKSKMTGAGRQCVTKGQAHGWSAFERGVMIKQGNKRSAEVSTCASLYLSMGRLSSKHLSASTNYDHPPTPCLNTHVIRKGTPEASMGLRRRGVQRSHTLSRISCLNESNANQLLVQGDAACKSVPHVISTNILQPAHPKGRTCGDAILQVHGHSKRGVHGFLVL